MTSRILHHPTYSVLPELLDKNRLYEITGMARSDMIDAVKKGYRISPLIVFYGNSASNINRRDVSAVRYICGNKRYVYARLKEMEFKTWMDYRLYRFIPNEDLTYGKIGSPKSIEPDYLLEMAVHIPKRKRIALLKRNRIWLNKHKEDPAMIAARERFKEKVDKTVEQALKMFGSK